MTYEDFVNFLSVYGLLFFGVPNQGIRISHWLPIVRDQPNESLVRNLAPGSIYLRNLQDRFCRVFRFHDSRLVSIYETMKSKTAKVCIEDPQLPLAWKCLIVSEGRASRTLVSDRKHGSSGPPRLSSGPLPAWTETR
jgi:hypothetical protein